MAVRSGYGCAVRELASIVGDRHVLDGDAREYLADASRAQGVRGRADAVVLPGSAEEVAAVVAWCYEHDVAVVPRGGGTGYAAGAVPLDGGVVLGLERLGAVRAPGPRLRRREAEAGVATAPVRRRALEEGRMFPVDPGAAESSQIGGNVATNAGGPHCFKHGVTRAWVTGLEAVLAPGELVRVGGPVRKDVAGYDLRALLTGSEGTLGIVTAAWLRLVPAPEAQLPVVAAYRDAEAGCAAVLRVLAAGIVPAALEDVDAPAMEAAGGAFPGGPLRGFVVLAEADGLAAEAARVRDELVEALTDGATRLAAPEDRAAVRELWRWRDGV